MDAQERYDFIVEMVGRTFDIDCTGCGKTHSARYPSHPLEVRAHARDVRNYDLRKRGLLRTPHRSTEARRISRLRKEG
jgi:hypothetical protein